MGMSLHGAKNEEDGSLTYSHTPFRREGDTLLIKMNPDELEKIMLAWQRRLEIV